MLLVAMMEIRNSSPAGGSEEIATCSQGGLIHHRPVHRHSVASKPRKSLGYTLHWTRKSGQGGF